MRTVHRFLLYTVVFGMSVSLVAAGEAKSRRTTKMFPANAKFELLWNKGVFTEGVAVGPHGKIYFSDIPPDARPGRVLRFDPASGRTDVYCADSGKSNGLMFDRRGRLIAACGAAHGKQALCEITPAGRVKVLIGRYKGKRFNSLNDLVIHPSGRIYFSDPRYLGDEPVELSHMSVYRYDPDRSIHRVTTDISKPNGVVVSPDGNTLYVAETDNGTVHTQRGKETRGKRMTLNAFPINPDGSLGRKRVLHNFGEETGVDGMTVDVRGRIFAAVRSKKRNGITVFSPTGKILAYRKVPQLPTNCCFGIGKEAGILYVTAGTGLYRIRTNTRGFHPALAR